MVPIEQLGELYSALTSSAAIHETPPIVDNGDLRATSQRFVQYVGAALAAHTGPPSGIPRTRGNAHDAWGASLLHDSRKSNTSDDVSFNTIVLASTMSTFAGMLADDSDTERKGDNPTTPTLGDQPSVATDVQVEQQHQTTLSDLNAQLHVNAITIADLTQKMANQHITSASLEERLATSTITMATKDAQLATNKAVMSSMQADINDLINKRTQLQQQLESLRSELSLQISNSVAARDEFMRHTEVNAWLIFPYLIVAHA